MEIMVTEELWLSFYVAVIFVSLLSVLLLTAIIGIFVEWARYGLSGIGDYILLFIASALLVFLIVLISLGIQEGPIVQYKAEITDFNEVYERGYEIVGQEGELYILEKEDD